MQSEDLLTLLQRQGGPPHLEPVDGRHRLRSVSLVVERCRGRPSDLGSEGGGSDEVMFLSCSVVQVVGATMGEMIEKSGGHA